MHRRSFLKNAILTSTGLMILPVYSFSEEKQKGESPSTPDLENNFKDVPASARPMAYWMWMNGHISRKGLLLDLQRMKEMGIAGAFIFNVSIGIPAGTVKYGSDEWKDLVLFAVTHAKNLGLEIIMHNSPGYSSTGEHQVPPWLSMQQLVWSEKIVNSNGHIDIQLPQPFKKLNYYEDSFVIAYPSLAIESVLMKDAVVKITANDKDIDKSILLDEDKETFIILKATPIEPVELTIEFENLFEAQSISIWRLQKVSQDINDTSFDYPPVFTLEASKDGNTFEKIATIQMPFLRSMNAPGTQCFQTTKAKFFRLITTQNTSLSGVELHNGPRLKGWPGKMNFTDPDLTTVDQQINRDQVIDPKTVINLTKYLAKEGRLVWDAPVGRWTILRIGHTTTGASNVAAPATATGLEIDKFQKEAVDYYFSNFINDLLEKLKQNNSMFEGILIDSWEIGKQNWSSSFPLEFNNRCKYDIIGWLPAVTGRIVNSVNDTEDFLWDVRRIQADLVAENYYGAFFKQCKKLGIQLYGEPNGDGVFDSLQVGQYLDTSMGEFWTRYVPGTLNMCKESISSAHIYGQKIVAAEAFTGMPFTSKWTGYPYAFKSQGDHIYSMGINRFVLHVFVHQPYTTGLPGMTMGQWGTHFDRNQTWSKYSRPWIDYLSRTQYLLQQGFYVSDVCYFKGEDPAPGIPDINYVNPPTPKEYTGDVIGPQALMKTYIENKRICLPGGMSYSLMIMAPLQKISPAIITKLKELVADGMTLVVTVKPNDSTGLKGKVASQEEVIAITNKLFSDLDGVHTKERSFGKGKIYWNKPLDEIFLKLGMEPNFLFTSSNPDAAIHSTYRKMGETDIFFVSNHLRRKENILANFRINSKTPEIWNSETGEIYKTALYEFNGNRVMVPLELEPSGSLFIIFRNKENAYGYTSVSVDGKEIISTNTISDLSPDRYKDVEDNFTISVWIKPDTFAIPGKGIIIFPPEGELFYGNGHVACGLAAGQNAVRVFERQKGPNRDSDVIINKESILQGWTHIAVRYKNGAASLFINGQSETGKPSGKKVHPGLNNPPTDEFFSAAFEGNSTQPVLFNVALNDEQIDEIFNNGIPSPPPPFPVIISRNTKGVLNIIAWQNGNYAIKGKSSINIEIKECKFIPVENNWKLIFPLNSGAPASITLNKLISLHKHTDFGVRHFSGTVTYLKSFLYTAKLQQNQRILLDLGRVEVIAEVQINGKKLGIVWKEPYLLDITHVLIQGENKLQIKVTTLWPNRMIGDEYLPKENEYNANGFIKQFPEWFLNDQEKQGQRITFSAWNTFTKTDPLLESGLLGPVHIVVGIYKVIDDRI